METACPVIPVCIMENDKLPLKKCAKVCLLISVLAFIVDIIAFLFIKPYSCFFHVINEHNLFEYISALVAFGIICGGAFLVLSLVLYGLNFFLKDKPWYWYPFITKGKIEVLSTLSESEKKHLLKYSRWKGFFITLEVTPIIIILNLKSYNVLNVLILLFASIVWCIPSMLLKKRQDAFLEGKREEMRETSMG